MKEIISQSDAKVCLALGFFDSLHSGHRQIIEKTVDYARKNGFLSVVFTFVGNAVGILKGKSVYTYDEKKTLLSAMGADCVLPYEFTADTLRKTKKEFLDEVFSLFDVKAVFCGFDYTFGHKGEGNVDFLLSYCEEKGAKCFVSEKVIFDGKKLSTSLIKDELSSGNVKKAAVMLTEPYFIDGRVERGRGVGHLLGIPTANIEIKDDKFLPKNGVYGTKTVVDGKTYVSVTNVGPKPTFGDVTISVETLIKGFDGDIYNESIRVIFIEYLRDIRKFDDPTTLRDRVLADLAWEEDQ